MKKLVEDYLSGLKAKLARLEKREELADWSRVSGATEADLAALKAVYPDCPDALIELLRRVDGTYWREYQDKKITLEVFGSTCFDWHGKPYAYPYYLLSAAQILESAKDEGDMCDRFCQEPEDILDVIDVDARIDPMLPMGRRLHFADCINNGGSSQLYIDFNPKNGGKAGQIVRYLHDPDGFDIIGDSFAAYLEALMEGGFAFCDDDFLCDDDDDEET
ncbi:MAG: SMI1/KNR4 family protein [Zoogloeaceae bacterium]|jgi:hypothetical protein|nr:SMI1/KNR4 family protein [Zoogloeaceae bacterium]